MSYFLSVRYQDHSTGWEGISAGDEKFGHWTSTDVQGNCHTMAVSARHAETGTRGYYPCTSLFHSAIAASCVSSQECPTFFRNVCRVHMPSFYWLIDWLIESILPSFDCSIDWLIDWSIEGSKDRMIDWLATGNVFAYGGFPPGDANLVSFYAGTFFLRCSRGISGRKRNVENSQHARSGGDCPPFPMSFNTSTETPKYRAGAPRPNTISCGTRLKRPKLDAFCHGRICWP